MGSRWFVPSTPTTMNRLFLALFSMLLSLLAIAQKNAPVVGDAATLMDLLRKNYATLPEADRRTALEKDRALVIGTFKSYLDETQTARLADTLQRYEDSVKCACKVNLEGRITGARAHHKGAMRMIACLRDRRANLKAQYEQSLVFLQANAAVSEKKEHFFLPKHLSAVDDSLEENVAVRDTITLGRLKGIYGGNLYVQEVILLFVEKYGRLINSEVDANGGVDHASSVQKALPFLGGELDFQLIAEGLSKFLAKRLKQELTTHVISQVQKWLENDTLITAELKVLLPRTTAYLLTFQADQLTNFTQEVKQLIEDDLDHLLENAAGLRNTWRLKRLIQDHPDVDFAFEALELIPKLSGLKEPTDYFDLIEGSRNLSVWGELPNTGQLNRTKHNIAHGMRMAALLARSMVVIDNGQEKFAGPAILNTYKGDDDFFKLYMGFLYQQTVRYYDGLEFFGTGTPFKLEAVLQNGMRTSTLDASAKLFQLLATRLGNDVEAIQMGADQIRKASKLDKRVGPDTVHAFVRRVLDLTRSLTFAADTLSAFLGYTTLELRQKTSNYFLVAERSNDIILDLRQEKYAAGILKGLDLAADLMPDKPISQVASASARLAEVDARAVANDWKKLNALVKGEEPATAPYSHKLKAKGSTPERAQRLLPGLLAMKESAKRQSAPGNVYAAAEAKLAAAIDVLQNLKRRGERFFTSSPNTALNNLKSDPIVQKMYFTHLSGMEIGTLPGPAATEPFKLDVVQHTELSRYADDTGEDLLKGNRKKAQAELDSARGILNDVASTSPQNTRPSTFKQVLKVVHLMNDLAAADSAEAVAAAIEAFALPAGSFAIKRAAIFNVSLNAYPGMLGGFGYVDGKQRSGVTGFTAPVGFSTTWRSSCFTFSGGRKAASIGFFLPLIDVGAVTRLQFDGTEGLQPLPELTLQNLFSPGLYLHYGSPKNPISFHGGWQSGPELRYEDGAISNGARGSMFSLGIVVDIPIMNLYTKPYMD